ncbi:MAG: L,D-transpeptidase [Fibrobacteria bacterium]
MRLHLRPDFLLRKSLHLAWTTWNVHRDNRAAADAFRDPIRLDGNVRWRPPAARQARLIHWSAWTVVFLIGSLAFHLARPYLAGDKADSPGPDQEPASFRPEGSALASLSSTGSIAKAAEIPAPAVFPEIGYCLIACKRDRTLYVYKRDGRRWDRTAAFPMAIGRNSGDKGDAGDLRTPEGRFWIIGMLSGENKGKQYGPLVFELNYPRPGDVAEGKTGKGIWIHGVEAGKLPTWTHGCISLANEDVVALSAYADAGTPVVILPDSQTPDPSVQADVAGMEREYPSVMAAHRFRSGSDSTARAKLLKLARDFAAKEAKAFPELGLQALSADAKQAILARLEKWRSDWMSRSIDAYSANYDPDFKDRLGRDRQAFLDRKRKIFESRSRIEMEIREPRIESEGYARAKITFRQDYLAEGPQGPQRSSEIKSLRLEEGPDGWLIITE